MILPVTFSDPDYVSELKHAKPMDAGYDLAAAHRDYSISVGENVTIGTGICVALPDNVYGQLVMRSGMGVKKNLGCHIGTIDAGYRGEIFMQVRNHGEHPVVIKRGERFAQIIFQTFIDAEIDVLTADAFGELATVRGTTGFGSSGS